MTKISTNDPKWKQDEYWKNWLIRSKEFADAAEEISGPEATEMMTYLDKNLYQIMKIAIDNEQYVKPYDDFMKVSRVCKVMIPLSREEIRKSFNIETYSIRSIGLYTLLEGMMFTKSFRDNCGYDQVGIHRNCNLNTVPDDIRKEYAFNLLIPAMGGLFVPKRTSFTDWMETRKQLEYFDIMI